MIHRDADGDAAANLLERRWFASNAAVETMRSECAVRRTASRDRRRPVRLRGIFGGVTHGLMPV
jgi:hypothetical protein